MDGLKKACAGEVTHLIGALAGGIVSCIRGLVCNLILNCLLDFAADGTLQTLIGSIPYPDLATKFLLGCFVGLCFAALHWVVDFLCDRIFKPNADPNICNAIANFITGCIGGGLAAILPPIFGSALAGAIDAAGENICHALDPNKEPPTIPVPL